MANLRISNLTVHEDSVIQNADLIEVSRYNGATYDSRKMVASVALSGKAAAVHAHAATDITSGSMPDARIPASNVTQHTASINHNGLANLNLGGSNYQHLSDTQKTDLTNVLTGSPNDQHKHITNISPNVGIDSSTSQIPLTSGANYSAATDLVWAIDKYGKEILLDSAQSVNPDQGTDLYIGSRNINTGSIIMDPNVKSFTAKITNDILGGLQFRFSLFEGTYNKDSIMFVFYTPNPLAAYQWHKSVFVIHNGNLNPSSWLDNNIFDVSHFDPSYPGLDIYGNKSTIQYLHPDQIGTSVGDGRILLCKWNNSDMGYRADVHMYMFSESDFRAHYTDGDFLTNPAYNMLTNGGNPIRIFSTKSCGQIVKDITVSNTGTTYTDGVGYSLLFNTGALPGVNGTAAAGTFDVVAGSISNIVLSYKGFGYNTAPTVTFTNAPHGAGVTAVATVNMEDGWVDYYSNTVIGVGPSMGGGGRYYARLCYHSGREKLQLNAYHSVSTSFQSGHATVRGDIAILNSYDLTLSDIVNGNASWDPDVQSELSKPVGTSNPSNHFKYWASGESYGMQRMFSADAAFPYSDAAINAADYHPYSGLHWFYDYTLDELYATYFRGSDVPWLYINKINNGNTNPATPRTLHTMPTYNGTLYSANPGVYSDYTLYISPPYYVPAENVWSQGFQQYSTSLLLETETYPIKNVVYTSLKQPGYAPYLTILRDVDLWTSIDNSTNGLILVEPNTDVDDKTISWASTYKVDSLVPSSFDYQHLLYSMLSQHRHQLFIESSIALSSSSDIVYNSRHFMHNGPGRSITELKARIRNGVLGYTINNGSITTPTIVRAGAGYTVDGVFTEVIGSGSIDYTVTNGVITAVGAVVSGSGFYSHYVIEEGNKNGVIGYVINAGAVASPVIVDAGEELTNVIDAIAAIPGGSGGQIKYTIAGGIITTVSLQAGGSGYSYPTAEQYVEGGTEGEPEFKFYYSGRNTPPIDSDPSSLGFDFVPYFKAPYFPSISTLQDLYDYVTAQIALYPANGGYREVTWCMGSAYDSDRDLLYVLGYDHLEDDGSTPIAAAKFFYPQVFVYDYNNPATGWKKLYNSDDSQYYVNIAASDSQYAVFNSGESFQSYLTVGFEPNSAISNRHYMMIHFGVYASNSAPIMVGMEVFSWDGTLTGGGNKQVEKNTLYTDYTGNDSTAYKLSADSPIGSSYHSVYGYVMSMCSSNTFSQVDDASAFRCNNSLKFLTSRDYNGVAPQDPVTLPEDINGANGFLKKFWDEAIYTAKYLSFGAPSGSSTTISDIAIHLGGYYYESLTYAVGTVGGQSLDIALNKGSGPFTYATTYVYFTSISPTEINYYTYTTKLYESTPNSILAAKFVCNDSGIVSSEIYRNAFVDVVYPDSKTLSGGETSNADLLHGHNILPIVKRISSVYTGVDNVVLSAFGSGAPASLDNMFDNDVTTGTTAGTIAISSFETIEIDNISIKKGYVYCIFTTNASAGGGSGIVTSIESKYSNDASDDWAIIATTPANTSATAVRYTLSAPFWGRYLRLKITNTDGAKTGTIIVKEVQIYSD